MYLKKYIFDNLKYNFILSSTLVLFSKNNFCQMSYSHTEIIIPQKKFYIIKFISTST